jgi:hypothetical protein
LRHPGVVLRKRLWTVIIAMLVAVASVFLIARATGDVKPPRSRRSSSASGEAAIVPGTVSLPAVGAPLDLSPDGSTVLGSTDVGVRWVRVVDEPGVEDLVDVGDGRLPCDEVILIGRGANIITVGSLERMLVHRSTGPDARVEVRPG